MDGLAVADPPLDIPLPRPIGYFLGCPVFLGCNPLSGSLGYARHLHPPPHARPGRLHHRDPTRPRRRRRQLLVGAISPARQARQNASRMLSGGVGPASTPGVVLGVLRQRRASNSDTPGEPAGNGIRPGVRSWSPAQKTVVRKHQQAIVKQLRAAGATQAEAGAAVGTPEGTVARWEAEAKQPGSNLRAKDTSAPDVRVKVEPAAKPVIAERLDAGETQAQVAADYGVTDRTIRSPLVVWEGTGILLDGHNRLRIAKETGAEYQTVEVPFPTREVARHWVIRTHNNSIPGPTIASEVSATVWTPRGIVPSIHHRLHSWNN